MSSGNIATRIISEAARTVAEPSRIAKLFNRSKRTSFLFWAFGIKPATHAGEWKPDSSGLFKRQYSNYAEYLDHQRSKRAIIALGRHSQVFRPALAERLPECAGKSVLCLGARDGTECLSFRDKGAFAVGVDLDPGEGNAVVLPGDFQALQFADACVDIVYCNSLDHAFDLPKVLSEIRRVLKPDGIFIAEMAAAEHFGSTKAGGGAFEATWWTDHEAALRIIRESGFETPPPVSFMVPYPGAQVICQPSER